MDQYDRTPGATGTGGSANTPAFGSDAGAMRTAADHQIPDRTAPAHAASMGGAAGGGTATTTGQRAGESTQERAGGMMDRAEEKLTQGMRQAGDRIDSLAQRLDEVAEQRLSGAQGPQARVGQAAHSVADTMDSVANYLRNNDAQALRGDLERQMRERPLQTLLVAVAAGWVVGKVLR